MSAAGRVATGFSKPYVAKYSNVGTTISYSEGMQLARGVDVNISPESSDDNNFYADNVVAESASGQFTGGTVELTVDGLFTAAERLIMGLPAADADGWVAYGDNQSIPHIGIGFIVRFMSAGVTSYVPFVLPKVIFNAISTEAATQEDEIDWKTQQLTAQINRDDSANKVWKYLGKEYASEALAEAALCAKLGISYSA